jgi:hypothetical protein
VNPAFHVLLPASTTPVVPDFGAEDPEDLDYASRGILEGCEQPTLSGSRISDGVRHGLGAFTPPRTAIYFLGDIEIMASGR